MWPGMLGRGAGGGTGDRRTMDDAAQTLWASEGLFRARKPGEPESLWWGGMGGPAGAHPSIPPPHSSHSLPFKLPQAELSLWPQPPSRDVPPPVLVPVLPVGSSHPEPTWTLSASPI